MRTGLSAVPLLVRSLSGKSLLKNGSRAFHGTSIRSSFLEEEKSGYPKISDVKDEPKTRWQKAVQGWKIFREEFRTWRGEIAEHLRMDPNFIIPEGEVDVQWRFEGDPSILEKWIVTVDSDYGEGGSTASLELTRTGRGIFAGNLVPRATRDGKIKRSGYCNVASVKPLKSFARDSRLDWGPYTHLAMRVRGDGRSYLLLLGCPGEWDILWNDSYQYVLHTRGGPYWQYVRIPFSKFFLVSHGRIQDIQQPPPTHNIATVGITAADRIPGYFKLEIDYIGVEYDATHAERHAYELYKTPYKHYV